jgi:hypothetical protein
MVEGRKSAPELRTLKVGCRRVTPRFDSGHLHQTAPRAVWGDEQVSIARIMITTCVQVDDYLNSVKPITAEVKPLTMAAAAGR